MTYALKCVARLTGGDRKKIYREGLSLCRLNSMAVGLGGIMEEDNLEMVLL